MSATFMEKATFYLQFQINKHGQYCGHTNVEDAVNSLTPHELLCVISGAVDNPPSDEDCTKTFS